MTSVRYSTDPAFRQDVNAKWLAGVSEHYRREAAAGINSHSLFRIDQDDVQDTWDYTRRHTIDPDWCDSKERKEREP